MRVFVRWMGPWAMLFPLVLAGGCTDQPVPTRPDGDGNSGAEAVEVRSASFQVTSDAAVFSEELAKIGNENEVLVVLKDASEPGVSLEVFEGPDMAGLVGLPNRDPGTFTRSRPFANASHNSRKAVITALEAMGAEVYRTLSAPIINVRIPDGVRPGAVALLLRHPNVDFIEANEGLDVVLDGPSLSYPGARPVLDMAHVATAMHDNPLGLHHTLHSVADTNPDVEDAWDFTRGSGVTIGIMDSGFAHTGTDWHPDGRLLTASKGIEKRGFVDDYGCDSTAQANGACFARDDDPGDPNDPFGGEPCSEDDPRPECLCLDNEVSCPDDGLNGRASGHGTQMVGLVGANDNDEHTVGVAPDALTISMKVTCEDSNPAVSCSAQFEQDDITAAVVWAKDNVDILSMSWTLEKDLACFRLALRDAWDGGNGVLLLSSTGNERHHDNGYPQAYPEVMGVGGIDIDNNSFGNDGSEDIAAFSLGSTLFEPDGSGSYPAPAGGQTSASTAIVAGVAALVKAHNSWMTASQVRSRLEATINNSVTKSVNAWRAVTNTPRLMANIDGPDTVEEKEEVTWSASIFQSDPGKPPYTYLWTVEVTEGIDTVSTSEEFSDLISERPGDPFLITMTITDDVGQRVVRDLDVEITGSSILEVSGGG